MIEDMVERQRKRMLFVWSPLGILMFGVGGVSTVEHRWGFEHPSVIRGLLVGAFLVAVLIAFVFRTWRSSMSRQEQGEALSAAKRATSTPAVFAYAGTGAALVIALRDAAADAFVAALIFLVMSAVSVLTGVVAWFRKGVYEAPDVSARAKEIPHHDA